MISDTLQVHRPIIRGIDTLERVCWWVEIVVASAALITIMVAIAINIVSRFFDLSVMDLSEVALSAMLPLTFLGAAFCANIREHIRVDLVDTISNRIIRLLLDVAADLAFVAFSVFFVVASYGLFQFSYAFNEKLITTGIPVWLTIGFMIAGGALMMLHSILNIVRSIANFWIR